jgi:hypothetical protein
MTLIIQKPTGAKLNLAKTFTWNETVWNPSMISTALWLDAADASTITLDGSNVSQWNDKSGNNRHATQANTELRPTYASNSVIFSTKRLNIPAAAWPTNGYSIAMVVRPTGTGSQAGLVNIRSTPVDDPEIRLAVPNYNNYVYYNGGYINPTGFTNLLANKTMLCLEMSAGIKSELFINGTSLFTGTRAGALSPTGTFELGYYTGVANYANGTIWQLVVYPTSTDNRQRIEGWMAHQEGLTSLLPADHPYKTVGPTP